MSAEVTRARRDGEPKGEFPYMQVVPHAEDKVSIINFVLAQALITVECACVLPAVKACAIGKDTVNKNASRPCPGLPNPLKF